MEPHEREAILVAVREKIKRQRKSSTDPERPVSLDERRAHDKANISKILKKNKNLLVTWNQIMTSIIHGRQPRKFTRIKSASDFIDGFALNVPDGMSSKDLRQLLLENELDVQQPKP